MRTSRQKAADENMEDQQSNVGDETIEEDVGNLEEIMNLRSDQDKGELRRTNQEIMKVIRC